MYKSLFFTINLILLSQLSLASNPWESFREIAPELSDKLNALVTSKAITFMVMYPDVKVDNGVKERNPKNFDEALALYRSGNGELKETYLPLVINFIYERQEDIQKFGSVDLAKLFYEHTHTLGNKDNTETLTSNFENVIGSCLELGIIEQLSSTVYNGALKMDIVGKTTYKLNPNAGLAKSFLAYKALHAKTSSDQKDLQKDVFIAPLPPTIKKTKTPPPPGMMIQPLGQKRERDGPNTEDSPAPLKEGKIDLQNDENLKLMLEAFDKAPVAPQAKAQDLQRIFVEKITPLFMTYQLKKLGKFVGKDFIYENKAEILALLPTGFNTSDRYLNSQACALHRLHVQTFSLKNAQ